MAKPRVGIFGLTGCAGDQLVILNCEDRLLDLVELLDVRDFLMASSKNDEVGRLDIAFVEGAVVTERDERALLQVRDRATTLVALGTCAAWGGIAGGGPDAERAALFREIYGAGGPPPVAGPARALDAVVAVDLAITGCPIEREEFLSAVAHLLNGNPPLPSPVPVCTECRIRENRCLLLRDGQLCCGPVTAGGCAARCPSLGIPCIGCRGPAPDANYASALALFRSRGLERGEVARRLGAFAPAALAAARMEVHQ